MRRLVPLLLLLICLLPAQAAGKYIIHVDVEAKSLTVWQGDTLVKQYTIATGAWDTPTPLGTFTINSRFSGQMSGFGTCFLGLNVPWGNYGIHGTNKPESIGGNASHGCFRLRVKDAEELYDLTPNGTKVYIEGGAYGLLGDGLRTLKSGDRNSHVMEAQMRLRQQGFYFGSIDGIYGDAMSKAVLAARKAYGLTAADTVDAALYAKLGIVLFE